VDLEKDSNAVIVYAQEAAKQLAPRPWVLQDDGWYVNQNTGARQRMHPLVDTLKPRVHSLREVTSSSYSDRSEPLSANDASERGAAGAGRSSRRTAVTKLASDEQRSPDSAAAPAPALARTAPAPAPAPAAAPAPALAPAPVVRTDPSPAASQDSTGRPPSGGGNSELASRVTQLEAALRAAQLTHSEAQHRWHAERSTLADQLEHAQLRATMKPTAGDGANSVNMQSLLAEKQILMEKNQQEKKRYDDLRSRYDALQREHTDEIERLKDEHANDLAAARAGKNELINKLALAEAAMSSEGSPLQTVTQKIHEALEKLQSEATSNKAVEEQVSAAAIEIRQDMKARRDLEARAMGEDSSRTNLLLSSLDMKMQELQAYQAEMQRRQAVSLEKDNNWGS
jgi:hypothetical protein